MGFFRFWFVARLFGGSEGVYVDRGYGIAALGLVAEASSLPTTTAAGVERSVTDITCCIRVT